MTRDRTERSGRFEATREGFGFIRPDAGGEDLFVPTRATAGALHGDRVRYTRLPGAGRGLSAAAAVEAILVRAIARLTGVVAGRAKQLHLVPDHPRLPAALRLVGSLRGLEPGQRVLCRLHDPPESPGRLPAAEVVQILGDAQDPRLDADIVRTEFGLPGEFSPEVLAAAAAAAAGTGAWEPIVRRDFRAEPVLTIDPRDARDFDDAVSLARAGDGGWLLRVHIADVADAIPVGSALDRVARERGNSTYLPGAVIPMLPEALSNGLMSLAPGAPKRVLSVSARITADGQVTAYRVDEGLIVSRHRLTYEQVQAVLEGRGSIDGQVDLLLRRMDLLAQRLRARRFARGGFNLQVPEAHVTLDDAARTLGITRRRQERSHQIIEEFMILANRLACHFAQRRGQPYLYRIHPEPDLLGVAAFADHVRALAPEVAAADLAGLGALRRWLGAMESDLKCWRIHALFLRTLKRAVYSAEDRGHFGLGLRGYGHFTSPIRRYSDLYNHRIVKWILRHGTKPVPEPWRTAASAIARSCSNREEHSEEAERELTRIKILRWAEAHLGESYRGLVVAALRRGYFVELDPVPVDGFVGRDELEADRGFGRPSRRRLRDASGLGLGTPVIVQIARVDLRARRLLFAVRATGRRALTTDPARVEPLVDPEVSVGRQRGSRRRKATRGRSRGEKPARDRRGRGRSHR